MSTRIDIKLLLVVNSGVEDFEVSLSEGRDEESFICFYCIYSSVFYHNKVSCL